VFVNVTQFLRSYLQTFSAADFVKCKSDNFRICLSLAVPACFKESCCNKKCVLRTFVFIDHPVCRACFHAKCAYLPFDAVLFLLLARYVPNVAKEEL